MLPLHILKGGLNVLSNIGLHHKKLHNTIKHIYKSFIISWFTHYKTQTIDTFCNSCIEIENLLFMAIEFIVISCTKDSFIPSFAPQYSQPHHQAHSPQCHILLLVVMLCILCLFPFRISVLSFRPFSLDKFSLASLTSIASDRNLFIS